MLFTTYTNYNHELTRPLLNIYAISISNEKVIERFSSIACNRTIVSTKQRQEHDNLVTIQREKP